VQFFTMAWWRGTQTDDAIDPLHDRHAPEDIRALTMRFPRMTIRRLLALVAVLAVVLGLLATLQRRRERFRRLADEYQSAVHAVYIGPSDPYLEIPNYHSDLAERCRRVAARPWMPFEDDLVPPRGVREFWIAHEAVKRAYPGVDLRDYVAQIVADEPDLGDPPGTIVWAVRYRRRDNRSGMNVYVEDPVRIEIHNNGPPPDPPVPISRTPPQETHAPADTR
jgi:hypothetical protein